VGVEICKKTRLKKGPQFYQNLISIHFHVVSITRTLQYFDKLLFNILDDHACFGVNFIHVGQLHDGLLPIKRDY
jgi:hypothetical protein